MIVPFLQLDLLLLAFDLGVVGLYVRIIYCFTFRPIVIKPQLITLRITLDLYMLQHCPAVDLPYIYLGIYVFMSYLATSYCCAFSFTLNILELIIAFY